MNASDKSKNILWWGRFDPEYSRNRILRQLLRDAGYTLCDFQPRVSALGTFEAMFAGFGVPDAIWVPAFRQNDFASARRYADRHHIPLIFDPLISAWDKAVFERKKFPESAWRARRLQRWEQHMFSRADLVLADTALHARFFVEELLAPEKRTMVVPVGAEEQLFAVQPESSPESSPEVLFFGSFIQLQGPEVIVEAAMMVPEARWTLLGNGPLRKACEEKAIGYDHIRFEEWCPYEKLSARIGKADVLLGIFGSSAKSGRVIPNKAYQALACGRPLITRESEAYPVELRGDSSCGITFVPPADPAALAASVREMLQRPELLPDSGRQARHTYDIWFSEERIRQDLLGALAKCL